VRLAALGVVGAAAAVAIALVVGRGAGRSLAGTTQVAVTSVGPIALSASELKARAATLDQAVYWIGPVVGYRYELTRTTANSVFVRYLPPGVTAGANQGEYLVIATYPSVGALGAVKAADGGHPLTVAGGKGGIAAVERGKPTNVRVAFPHVDSQIEVYAPSADEARAVATSARLTPVP
jgi:hypothetical protein